MVTAFKCHYLLVLVMVDFLYHKYHLLVKINKRKKKKSEKKKKNIIKRWKKGILAFPRLFAWLSSPQFDLIIRSSFAVSSLVLFWGVVGIRFPPFACDQGILAVWMRQYEK